MFALMHCILYTIITQSKASVQYIVLYCRKNEHFMLHIGENNYLNSINIWAHEHSLKPTISFKKKWIPLIKKWSGIFNFLNFIKFSFKQLVHLSVASRKISPETKWIITWTIMNMKWVLVITCWTITMHSKVGREIKKNKIITECVMSAPTLMTDWLTLH